MAAPAQSPAQVVANALCEVLGDAGTHDGTRHVLDLVAMRDLFAQRVMKHNPEQRRYSVPTLNGKSKHVGGTGGYHTCVVCSKEADLQCGKCRAVYFHDGECAEAGNGEHRGGGKHSECKMLSDLAQAGKEVAEAAAGGATTFLDVLEKQVDILTRVAKITTARMDRLGSHLWQIFGSKFLLTVLDTHTAGGAGSRETVDDEVYVLDLMRATRRRCMAPAATASTASTGRWSTRIRAAGSSSSWQNAPCAWAHPTRSPWNGRPNLSTVSRCASMSNFVTDMLRMAAGVMRPMVTWQMPQSGLPRAASDGLQGQSTSGACPVARELPTDANGAARWCIATRRASVLIGRSTRKCVRVSGRDEQRRPGGILFFIKCASGSPRTIQVNQETLSCMSHSDRIETQSNWNPSLSS